MCPINFMYKLKISIWCLLSAYMFLVFSRTTLERDASIHTVTPQNIHRDKWSLVPKLRQMTFDEYAVNDCRTWGRMGYRKLKQNSLKKKILIINETITIHMIHKIKQLVSDMYYFVYGRKNDLIKWWALGTSWNGEGLCSNEWELW